MKPRGADKTMLNIATDIIPTQKSQATLTVSQSGGNPCSRTEKLGEKGSQPDFWEGFLRFASRVAEDKRTES